MSSPYPWHYNLRWLLDYFSPSTKNPTDLVPEPRAATWSDAPRALRLAFLGDLMCLQNDRLPEIADEVRAVTADADVVFVNCEAPVIFAESRSFARYVGHFAMAEEFLFGLLERLGVTPERAVLSIANNHIADQGPEGIADSVARIEKHGAVAVGARLSEDAAPMRVVERSGVKLGVVAWSHWLNSGHRLERVPNIFRTEAIDSYDWTGARSEVDLMVAFPHWELEFRHFPRAETRARASALASAGFDVIAGHHPHVLMPIERFGETLCMYSLGNLDGPALRRVGWPVRLGGILTVDVAKSAVLGYALHPFVQTEPELERVRIEPLTDAHPKMTARFDLVAAPATGTK